LLPIERNTGLLPVKIEDVEKAISPLAGAISAMSTSIALLAASSGGATSNTILNALVSITTALNTFFPFLSNSLFQMTSPALGLQWLVNLGNIRVPAFKDEGSFRVGGYGGPDSQFVPFWATPGERVSVTHGPEDGETVEMLRAIGKAIERGNNDAEEREAILRKEIRELREVVRRQQNSLDRLITKV